MPIDSIAHPPWQVPILLPKRWTYDDQGFLTFPERVGVDVSRLLQKDCSHLLLEDLAPFLQEWLWFGLLKETLGTTSRVQIPRTAFIIEREDGIEIITTAELRRYILLASIENHFDDSDLTMYESCVGRALEIVNGILSRWPYTPDFAPSSVHLILFSIQILCETLLTSREVLFPGYRLQLTPMSSFGSQVTHMVDSVLLRASWCWSEIQGLPKQNVLRYYLSYMNRSSNQHNHSDCSREGCVFPSIPDHALRPVHTSEDCLCEDTTIYDDIIELTGQGIVPLLLFSEQSGGQRQLTVLKHSLSEAPNFIAFSHVRHLGLGSSTSNTLPYCQLSRLQTLAGTMPFWIDTMCVPLPKKARKVALLSAPHIFAAATAVLVLDPCLHRHAVGSATEALLRIKYSIWAKRLWTIQEGALANNLRFQFFNGVRSLDDMLSEYEKDRALDILHLLPYRPAAADGDSRVDKLMQMQARLNSDMLAAERTLAHIGKAERRFDRLRLRTVLRWGYLASQKLYWMVDEGEAWRLRAVTDVLEQVYAAGNAGESDTDMLLERLRFISAIDLKFKDDVAGF